MLDAGPVLRRAAELAAGGPGDVRAAIAVGLDVLAAGQTDIFRSLANRPDGEPGAFVVA